MVARSVFDEKIVNYRYRRPVLNLGRRGFDGFDFSRFNTTEFAGLENSHAHAYVNRSAANRLPSDWYCTLPTRDKIRVWRGEGGVTRQTPPPYSRDLGSF